MSGGLSFVIDEIIKFRDDRDWLQFHDPKNLSQAISIEAAELQEIFLWMSTEKSKRLPADKLQKLRNEVADIFIFMIYLCNHFDIDILEAVLNKIQMNKKKYPVDKSKGSSKKYNELSDKTRID
jgi:NTP pyrophosphatase (non-canonical NTP hydrolase)